MNALKIRADLRRMGRRELFRLVAEQKISKCLIGATACRFHLCYERLTFCASEIMGYSCQLEKLKGLEEVCEQPENIKHLPILIPGIEKKCILAERETEFKVYHKDRSIGSLVFLGKVRERRRKEREDNLKDLLKKAIMDYSDCAKDPSGIFLINC